MKPSISAVLVTRGDVDMAPILATLPYDDVVVWDNSKREDLGIYGRYAGIAEAKHDLIYVQDDDLLFVEHAKLAAAYTPGRAVFNSLPAQDIPWCARGAVFHRDLPAQVFEPYLAEYPFDREFTHHGCDLVFGILAPVDRVWFGSTDLPYATADGRVSTSPGWWDKDGIRQRMHNRAFGLKDRT